jgi:phosphatidylglycerol:prolipoprotein diacylglycerol transferase
LNLFSYIIWNPNPIFLRFGSFTIFWYSFLFALGFIVSRFVIISIYKTEKRFKNNLDFLLVYMIVGTVIGARIGHVVFYEPFKYLNNPIDILKIWEGGLSSHGCAIGILIALYFYVYKIELKGKKWQITKHHRQGHSWLQIVDRMAIVVALGSIFIRFGNFMNSEIIGTPTGSNYGVVFVGTKIQEIKNRIPAVKMISIIDQDANLNTNHPKLTLEIQLYERISSLEQATNILIKNVKPLLLKKQKIPTLIHTEDGRMNVIKTSQGYKGYFKMDGIVRHPSQLYEAAVCLLTFLILMLVWSKKKDQTPHGLIWGLFLLFIFGSRILQEVIKENNVTFGNNFVLNQGQFLSIPFVLLGFLLIRSAYLKSTSD